MSSGAFYGAGIYLADNMSTSMRYSSMRGQSYTHWYNSRNEGDAVILAVCEVIER